MSLYTPLKKRLPLHFPCSFSFGSPLLGSIGQSRSDAFIKYEGLKGHRVWSLGSGLEWHLTAKFQEKKQAWTYTKPQALNDYEVDMDSQSPRGIGRGITEHSLCPLQV